MGTTIMLKNTPVLHFDMDNGVYEILYPELMPYQLRGKLLDVPKLGENAGKYEATQLAIAMARNATTMQAYFAGRVLPITRDNAKKIYELFGFEQAQDDHSKALIALSCRSVSLQDNYWVKDDNEDKTWDDVNIRTNALNEVVAQVALHGRSLTLRGGEAHTPELNGQGVYAKAWKNDLDGLFLYKLGSSRDDRESRIEVMVSKILDKTNVPHVKYYDALTEGRMACRCKCMTTEKLSILPGLDYHSYCDVNGIDFEKSIMEIDSDNIYKMWIVDYLISNRDRHGMNWGFYYDADSLKILKCHPLFDHNNAFDTELMKNKDAPYLFDQKMTMKEAAEYAIRHVDFHFTEEIKKTDFLDTEQYDSFRSRAEDLSLKII